MMHMQHHSNCAIICHLHSHATTVDLHSTSLFSGVIQVGQAPRNRTFAGNCSRCAVVVAHPSVSKHCLELEALMKKSPLHHQLTPKETLD